MKSARKATNTKVFYNLIGGISTSRGVIFLPVLVVIVLYIEVLI